MNLNEYEFVTDSGDRLVMKNGIIKRVGENGALFQPTKKEIEFVNEQLNLTTETEKTIEIVALVVALVACIAIGIASKFL